MLDDGASSGITEILALFGCPWFLFSSSGEIKDIKSDSFGPGKAIPRNPAEGLYETLEALAPGTMEVIRSAVSHGADPGVDRPVRLPDGHFCVLSIRRVSKDLFLALFRSSTEVDFLDTVSKAGQWMDSRGSMALFLVDDAARISSWNGAARSMFHWNVNEAVQRGMDQLFAEEDAGLASEGVRIARERGWFEQDALLRRRDGSTFSGRVAIARQRGFEHFIVAVSDLGWAKLVENRLKDMATRDHLTGAFNRRHFADIVAREILRLRRYGGELSLIMIDADHFKKINDTYGHEAGDRVLQLMVDVFNDSARQVDVVTRLGGEEFAILLPCTTISGAHTMAERVRHRVEQLRVEHNGQDIRFTVSIGVASITSADQDMDYLLRLADQALYAAKRGGRNRVEICQPGPDDPVIAA